MEQYWNTLKGLWLAVDRRRPNPMKCDEDITIFNQLIEQERLQTFIGGLDGEYDNIRREILRLNDVNPFFLVESANGIVRKEATRSKILRTTTNHAEASSLEGIGVCD